MWLTLSFLFSGAACLFAGFKMGRNRNKAQLEQAERELSSERCNAHRERCEFQERFDRLTKECNVVVAQWDIADAVIDNILNEFHDARERQATLHDAMTERDKTSTSGR